MKNANDYLPIWIGRSCVFTLLIFGALNLVLAIKSGDQNFLIPYSVIRLIFILGALLFARVRLSVRYYAAGFHEMTEVLYWYFVVIIVTAFALVPLCFSVKFPPILSEINAGTIVGFLLYMLLLYQTKPWTHAQQQQRLARIRKLTQKAHLSKAEFALIAPKLADATQVKQKAPITWRIAKWSTIILLGILLNVYASVIVDTFARIDVFRPFLGK